MPDSKVINNPFLDDQNTNKVTEQSVSKFDPSTAKPVVENQTQVSKDKNFNFDPSTAKAVDKGFSGHARDLGASLMGGLATVPDIAVGVADLYTGGRAGKAVDNLSDNFKLGQAQKYWQDQKTDQAKVQSQQFADAEGIIDKTKVALSNPSIIANTVTESLPSMAVGGLAGRGINIASKGAIGAAASGAIGEGAVMAGSQAEQIRQKTDDGLLTGKQTAAAAGTGVAGSLLGFLGGTVAKKLGFEDVDTLMAKGVKPEQVAQEITQIPFSSIPKSVVLGAISEGLLEEMPQSVTEQVLQNYALDKDLFNGVDDAIVMGTLAGMAMGGTVAGTSQASKWAGQPNSANPDTNNDADTTGLNPLLPAPTGGGSGIPGLGYDGLQGEYIPAGAQASAQPTQARQNFEYDQMPTDAESQIEFGGLSRQYAPTPSEQMGIDPNVGLLSSAAAAAVDTGISQQFQIEMQVQAASEASPNPAGKTEDNNAPLQQAADAARQLTPEQIHGTQNKYSPEVISALETLRQRQQGEQSGSVTLNESTQNEAAQRGNAPLNNGSQSLPQQYDTNATSQMGTATGAAQKGLQPAQSDAGRAISSNQSINEIQTSEVKSKLLGVQSKVTELEAQLATEKSVPKKAQIRKQIAELQSELYIQAQSDVNIDNPQKSTVENHRENFAKMDRSIAKVNAVRQRMREANPEIFTEANDRVRETHGLTNARVTAIADEIESSGSYELSDREYDKVKNNPNYKIDYNPKTFTGKVIAVKDQHSGEWLGNKEQSNGQSTAQINTGHVTQNEIQTSNNQTRVSELEAQLATEKSIPKKAQLRKQLENLNAERAAISKNNEPAMTPESSLREGARNDSVTTSSFQMQPLDHGALNVPLSKRGNIDAQLDQYKKEQTALENEKRAIQKGNHADAQAIAKPMFDTLSTEQIKTYANKAGIKPSEAKKELKSMTHWQPQKAVKVFEALKEVGTKQDKPVTPPTLPNLGGVEQIQVLEQQLAVEKSVPKKAQIRKQIAELQKHSPIDQAAHQAATSIQNDLPEPTQAQIEAGNYKKGHIKVHGLDIAIENPRGSERRGTDPDGKEWSHQMSDHYGYLKTTTGADNEQIDTYVGSNPESEQVFIVDQLDQQTGGFDEHKVMLGFNSQDEAIKAYSSNFDKGWKVGPVRAMTKDEFKTWLKEGDTTKPSMDDKSITITEEKQLGDIFNEKSTGQLKENIHEQNDRVERVLIENGNTQPGESGSNSSTSGRNHGARKSRAVGIVENKDSGRISSSTQRETRTDANNSTRVGESQDNKRTNANLGKDSEGIANASAEINIDELLGKLAGKANRLADVVDDLAALKDSSEGNYSRKLLRLIARLNPDVRIHIVSDLNTIDDSVIRAGLVEGGFFVPDQDTSYIYPNTKSWGGSKLELVNHELVHSVTEKYITDGHISNENMKKLNEIRDALDNYRIDNYLDLSEHAVDRLDYASSTNFPHELFSVGMSETDIRTELKEALGENGLGELDAIFKEISNSLSNTKTKNKKFSHADGITAGSTVKQVREALISRFGEKTIADLETQGILNIVQDQQQGMTGNVEGWYENGKVTLVASNLDADSAVATFLHELGGHGGFQNLMNKDAYADLMHQFERMIEQGNPVAIEAKRLAERELNKDVQLDEYLPYMITLASQMQLKNIVQKGAIKRFMDRIVSAVKAWLYDKGIKLNLNENDVLALAERMVEKQSGITAVQRVKQQLENTSAWMKAPNGNPTRLTEQQWLQVRTPAFKRWFGDWENNPAQASQAVDENGEPKIYYHGTAAEFSKFNRGGGLLGRGVYLTDDLATAQMYGDVKSNNNGIVMPLFVNTKQTMQATDRTSREQIDHASASGRFDGIRRSFQDMDFLVAFNSNQVKHAMNNEGSFDGQNDDIRFSRQFNAQQTFDNIMNGVKGLNVQSTKNWAGNKWIDWLGLALSGLGRRQLTEIYSKILPSLSKYNELAAQMDADKNDAGAEADTIVREWSNLKDDNQLADLMHDATLAKIDPVKPHVAGDSIIKYKQLRDDFNALSPEAQDIYLKARDAYKKHYAKVHQAIKERILRSELSNTKKAELLKDMDNQFFGYVKGVYFPLARFGKYVVIVRNQNGQVESVSRAETMAEAQKMRAKMMKKFPLWKVDRVILDKEFNASRDGVGRGFMSSLFSEVDNLGLSTAEQAEFEDTLSQLYLSSMPDLSWAKHGIHRKGTAGFSQDARRAFAQNMFHGAGYLAKLRYGDQMAEQLDEMQKYATEQAKTNPEYDQPKAQRVIDEMNKRHENLMNPKSHPLSSMLTSVGFIYYLGLSPAAAMVNLSQTPLVAYPIMGAKWGFDNAAKELLKASNDFRKGVEFHKVKWEGTKTDLYKAVSSDISKFLNKDEQQAYKDAVDRGVIDVTQAHDLAGIAQGEDSGVMWKMRPIMRAASTMFHSAERFNREVTFIAAYRLSRQTGATHDTAFDQAVDATYKGHFDYSSGNRPRIMQGNVAKVLLLFKQFGQNMIYTLSRQTYQSIKGETEAERKEARRALGAVLGMHAAFAGVLGLPLVGFLLGAASWMGGDDDDPWDAEVALRNYLAETFNPTISNLIMKGVPRAVTPIDMSGRVGINNLLLPDVQEGLEGKRWAESAMSAALGPVAGIGTNMVKGAQEISEGHNLRGVETMLPVFLKNFAKTYRYSDEGVQDKTGVSIMDEVSSMDLLVQGMGFSPSDVRTANEGKSAIFQANRKLNERRSSLMTLWSRAKMMDDQEEMDNIWEEIQGFNEKNPTRRITRMNLNQSYRNRKRRIDRAEDGVYLSRNQQGVREAGNFAFAE
ncbi:PLxRFG domain-containing protein [Acinetobacter sp. BSP-28]|uniref:PLxRFG domain-containing protein n=1 Tax=Acinetobacter sp. BSP-28 TaxID=3344661 RepID=UPI00377059CD